MDQPVQGALRGLVIERRQCLDREPHKVRKGLEKT